MKTSWYKLTIDEISSKPFKLKILSPNENSKGIILHFHGFPGGPVNEEYYTEEMFVKLGYSFITFNYPGLWDSPGNFSIDNLFSSTFRIIDEIVTQISSSRCKIILFCESFGAAVGIHLISERSSIIDRIIFRSPFLDFDPLLPYLPMTFRQLENFGILKLPKENFNFDRLPQYNPKNLIKNLPEIPIWGVIGKNDSVLPCEFMLKAAEQKSTINLEVWDDFPHNDISLDLLKKFFNSVKKFLEKR